jgi:methionine-rich copper-binding protein CopC
VEVCKLRRFLQGPAVCLLLLFILVAGVAKPVWAHAILMQSKPAINSSVKGPNIPIWLRFNVRVDGKRSRLTLVASDGTSVDLPAPKQTAPDVLEAQATGVKPGTYKLQWRALASDGHMSSGVVEFTVN